MEWIMRPHTLSPLPPFDWLFLTDAGLDTDLIYNQGIDLPFFASLSLLRTESGRPALKAYYRPYLELAEIGRPSCRERCFSMFRSGWSLSNTQKKHMKYILDLKT